MATYTVTGNFTLRRRHVGGLEGQLIAVPGDELRPEPDDFGATCFFVLVRGDGGAETPVRCDLSEVRQFVRAS